MRKPFCRFLRELNSLKRSADYQSCDPSKLADWLKQIGSEFTQYSYQLVTRGVDKATLRWLNDTHLLTDCGIHNGVHRLKILENAKRIKPIYWS